MVDAADQEKFETAKKELQELMSKPPLAGIPLLVLANKNDLPEAVGVHDTIELLYGALIHASLPSSSPLLLTLQLVTISYAPLCAAPAGTSNQSRAARCAATPSRPRTMSTST